MLFRSAPAADWTVGGATGGYEVPIPAVLDGAALALTVRPGPGERRSLPPDPPTDEEGLPMRYVYRGETPLATG